MEFKHVTYAHKHKGGFWIIDLKENNKTTNLTWLTHKNTKGGDEDWIFL